MVTLSLGNKKRTFKSIRMAADEMGIKYITLYMRLRAGVKPATAVKKPVRVYKRKVSC